MKAAKDAKEAKNNEVKPEPSNIVEEGPQTVVGNTVTEMDNSTNVHRNKRRKKIVDEQPARTNPSELTLEDFDSQIEMRNLEQNL